MRSCDKLIRLSTQPWWSHHQGQLTATTCPSGPTALACELKVEGCRALFGSDDEELEGSSYATCDGGEVERAMRHASITCHSSAVTAWYLR